MKLDPCICPAVAKFHASSHDDPSSAARPSVSAGSSASETLVSSGVQQQSIW